MQHRKSDLLYVFVTALLFCNFKIVSSATENLTFLKKEINPTLDPDTIPQLSGAQKLQHFQKLLECQTQTECPGVLRGYSDGEGTFSETITYNNIFQNNLFTNQDHWILYYKTNWTAIYSCENTELPPYTTQNGKYCYFITADEFYDFDDALQTCSDVGMQLSSLETSDELMHVLKHVGEDTVWINLERLDTSGTDLRTGWYWGSDGSSLAYNRWFEGQPTNPNLLCATLKTLAADNTGLRTKRCNSGTSQKSLCEAFTPWSLPGITL